MSDGVTVIVDRGIATVTLDRPPVDALADETFHRIADVMDALGSARDASVIVFRAADGSRAFCGGVDLRTPSGRHRPDGRHPVTGAQGDARDQVDPGRAPRRCFEAVRHCGLPVIAAVHGTVIGAGVALVASCDLVVATTESSFALTEIDVGVLGGVRHAQRLCGPFLAKRMFLTGEPAMADEIYRRGGLEAVVDAERLVSTVTTLAATTAAKSPTRSVSPRSLRTGWSRCRWRTGTAANRTTRSG